MMIKMILTSFKLVSELRPETTKTSPNKNINSDDMCEGLCDKKEGLMNFKPSLITVSE